MFKVSGHPLKNWHSSFRHGVTHMDASVENTETETLIRHKTEAAEAGVSLEMIHIGLPKSITLAQDPPARHGY